MGCSGYVEAPRITFKESRSPMKFPNYMALMINIIKDAVNEEVWRKSMVMNDTWNILLGPEGKSVLGGSSRSIFHVMREY